MKTIKTTKKPMIILVCIVLLIAIGIVVGHFIYKKINNPYRVKVVDLPMKYEYYNFGGTFFQNYIESTDEFNNIFDSRYSELNDEQKKNYKSHKMIFKKYDDEFFKSNFIYFAKSSSPYYGRSSLPQDLKLQNVFTLKKKSD